MPEQFTQSKIYSSCKEVHHHPRSLDVTSATKGVFWGALRERHDARHCACWYSEKNNWNVFILAWTSCSPLINAVSCCSDSSGCGTQLMEAIKVPNIAKWRDAGALRLKNYRSLKQDRKIWSAVPQAVFNWTGSSKHPWDQSVICKVEWWCCECTLRPNIRRPW